MSTAVEGQADNQPKSASDDPLVWIDCEVGRMSCYVVEWLELTHRPSTDDWSRPGQ
jgi:hypothetical protein